MSKLQLPNEDELYAGSQAIVTGYGMTWLNFSDGSDIGVSDYKLKYAEAKVLSNEQCNHDIRMESKLFPPVYSNQICARVIQNEKPKAPSGVCYVSLQ